MIKSSLIVGELTEHSAIAVSPASIGEFHGDWED
jgi:hypothetical protein